MKTETRKGVDFAYLMRRVQAHELFNQGFHLDEIAEALKIPMKNLRRYLNMRKPILAEPCRNQSWREFAACTGNDIDLFFPTVRGVRAKNLKRDAMAICARCPVREQCYQTALANYENYGVWGGEDFSKFEYEFDEETGEVTRTYVGAEQKIS